MSIQVFELSEDEALKVLSQEEGHFIDMKAKGVSPAKLTKSMSAFANADGGELFIGVAEIDDSWVWAGFSNQEAANGHIQAFEDSFPLGSEYRYEFLSSESRPGLVLKATVLKSRDIVSASDGRVFVRRGAQSLPVTSEAALKRLRLTKGLVSHEDATLPVDVSRIADSLEIVKFMIEVVPHQSPESWLRKQQLVVDFKPVVAGALLFDDEPQALLPKASVKIYRYKTSKSEGTRETLVFDPITIEGPIYDLIYSSVEKTTEITEEIKIATPDGLAEIKYPKEALHEIITNAVLHRDYSHNDDIHVRIFDNRIEVESPGRLPAHITSSNILSERFARNPKIVRLVNKYPNPPNKDVGEGLNTAFRAMKKLRLRDPQITEGDNSVLVQIRHESLASPEQQIIGYVDQNGTINNSEARDATGIESEAHVRRVFKKLIEMSELERVPGTRKSGTRYRRPDSK
jgi:ATP-dependent DNA helicase RecG